jgi:hypothetical protein
MGNSVGRRLLARGLKTQQPVISAVPPLSEDTTLNTDKQNTRILARTFFNQLRSSGYTPTQIIGMATELLDLVTEDIKGVDKNVAVQTNEARPDFRQEA